MLKLTNKYWLIIIIYDQRMRKSASTEDICKAFTDPMQSRDGKEIDSTSYKLGASNFALLQ